MINRASFDIGIWIPIPTRITSNAWSCVCMLHITDGDIDLNKELLKAGLAWHYKQYSRDPELQKLENQARMKKIGLWSEPDSVAPWGWRRQKRSGKTKFEFSGGISGTIEQ